MDIVNEKDIAALLKRDKIFRSINLQFGAPPNWQRPPGFISLSRIILEQQVSLASANAHFKKLDKALEEFTPANILKLTDEEMRNCQISRQKAKYLRALSEAVLNQTNDLNSLHELSDAEAKKRLTTIKGIGNWTADVYLLFCLQCKDVFPIGDIALVNTVKELANLSTNEEILLKVDQWRPLRSLAAYFLWHHYLRKRNREAIT